jgi:hypothetical protein
LVEPLSKAAPALSMFSNAFKTAMDLLTSANINTDAIIKTIDNLTNILYTDDKTGIFSGKVSTASKITELADSLSSVNIADQLNKITPSLSTFSTVFTNAITALNSTKLDASISDTLRDLSNILYTDTGAGLFTSGKTTTASKINELAASIGELSAKTAELNNPTTTSSKGGAKLLSPSDLQKKTIDFYDNQRQSNASLIQLLQIVNSKLDDLNSMVDDSSDEIVDAIKKSSGKVY